MAKKKPSNVHFVRLRTYMSCSKGAYQKNIHKESYENPPNEREIITLQRWKEHY